MKQTAWECWLGLCVILILCVLVFGNRLQRYEEPPAPDEAAAPIVTPEPASPETQPVARGCNCCTACQCGPDCHCAETGKRCSPDCTCGETTAIYYCRICGKHKYKFPNGRPTEPRLFCPHCKRVEFRENTKEGVEIKRWFEAAARTRSMQTGNC